MSSFAKHLLAASAAVLAAGSAVLVTASPAHAKDVTVFAQPPEDTLSTRVIFADLKLTATAGQKVLHRRVSRAVRDVCAPLEQRGIASKHGECMDFAWSGARPQMAQAVERARQLAANGSSSIAPVAIAVRGIGQ